MLVLRVFGNLSKNAGAIIRQSVRGKCSKPVETISCCPPGSWGHLENKKYQDKGQVVQIDDLEVYVVGEPGENAIIWSNDVYGFNKGRTRQMCDLFAAEGYYVLLPNFYRDDWIHPYKEFELVKAFMQKHSVWENLDNDISKKVMPFAKQNGVKKFASVGTCWGSYVVLRSSTNDQFKCGVSFHPTHSVMINHFLQPHEPEENVLSRVTSPQLICPASNDHSNCKKGGLADKIMGDAVQIVEFKDMIHGWTTRGDMADPLIKRDVNKVIQISLDFINEHMKSSDTKDTCMKN